ncbi:hypothetical protein [Rubidibacter lacunae]|uniref:hypothetical protein n=1 Tax=Rubidibacter lacunae TaxID=582514 RepID=UPI0003F4E24D|nr:hypothetical protein [Rubidibacter lacunae]
MDIDCWGVRAVVPLDFAFLDLFSADADAGLVFRDLSDSEADFVTFPDLVVVPVAARGVLAVLRSLVADDDVVDAAAEGAFVVLAPFALIVFVDLRDLAADAVDTPATAGGDLVTLDAVAFFDGVAVALALEDADLDVVAFVDLGTVAFLDLDAVTLDAAVFADLDTVAGNVADVADGADKDFGVETEVDDSRSSNTIKRSRSFPISALTASSICSQSGDSCCWVSWGLGGSGWLSPSSAMSNFPSRSAVTSRCNALGCDRSRSLQ